MSLSQLGRSIAESPTLKLNAQAGALRAKGEAVIHLGGGQPQNKAPIAAVLSSTAKLEEGHIKYTPSDGTPSLKRAIIHYTEENYGKHVELENVIVSNGAKHSLYNVLMALVDPQEEVILLAPYWVSYPEMIKMVNGVPVIVTPGDGSFVPRIDEVEQAISSRTKAVIVNSPNNPSGMMYSEDFIAQIVALCEERGIYLIMDDIYHKLVFDGKTAPIAYNYTDRGINDTRVVVVNGVSKLYGMTGFRIGWTIASKEMVKVMNNIQSQTTSNPSAISQVAAEGALNGDQSVVEDLRMEIENNRDIMVRELGALPGIRITIPDGTFYCMPDFRAYYQSSMELSEMLLEKALVVTVPGGEFGMEGHLRISYCGTAEEIVEGAKRIKWALDPNAPSEIEIGGRKVVRDWL